MAGTFPFVFPYAFPVVFVDTFTVADGALPAGWIPATAPAPVGYSGQFVAPNANAFASAYCGTLASSSTQRVRVVVGADVPDMVVLYLRVKNDASTNVYAQLVTGSVWQIVTSPDYTVRASSSGTTFTTADEITFEAVGTVYTVRKNGIAVVTWTDSGGAYTFAETGYAYGAVGVQSSTTNKGVTEFSFEDYWRFMEGAVSALLKQPTASLTNAVPPSGIVGGAAQKATAALAGTQTQSGVMGCAVKKATASLAGIEHARGAIAGAPRKATASLAGTQQQSGVVAGRAAKAVAALAGFLLPSGVVAGAAKRATASLTGTQQQSGVVAGTAMKATAALAGFLLPSGVVAGAVRPATAELSGTSIGSASLFATALPATAALAGLQTQTGLIAGTGRAAVAALSGAQVHLGVVSASAGKADRKSVV